MLAGAQGFGSCSLDHPAPGLGQGWDEQARSQDPPHAPQRGDPREPRGRGAPCGGLPARTLKGPPPPAALAGEHRLRPVAAPRERPSLRLRRPPWRPPPRDGPATRRRRERRPPARGRRGRGPGPRRAPTPPPSTRGWAAAPLATTERSAREAIAPSRRGAAARRCLPPPCVRRAERAPSRTVPRPGPPSGPPTHRLDARTGPGKPKASRSEPSQSLESVFIGAGQARVHASATRTLSQMSAGRPWRSRRLQKGSTRLRSAWRARSSGVRPARPRMASIGAMAPSSQAIRRGRGSASWAASPMTRPAPFSPAGSPAACGLAPTARA